MMMRENAVLAQLAEAATCFHCDLPVPPDTHWRVDIDGAAQPMCCPGCAAVAQAIVDSGFADYYSTRTGFAATATQAALVPPELQLYDSASGTSDPADPSNVEATFLIEGIRCAACVWLIERRLLRLAGVQSALMNVSTERLQVCWRSDLCKPSQIAATLRAIGYAAYPFDPVRHGAQLDRAKRTLFRQLFIAGLCMMQVMMYALPMYLATDGTMDADMAALMRWAGLLLTLPALTYSALPFYRGAWVNLKSGMLGMDVPVVLGISAAFVGSVVATWRGVGEVYFDSITMFIFLLLCSRYLELLARRKAASALSRMQNALPASALRLTGYPDARTTELVAPTALAEGDLILIRPGDAVAADGIIIDGASSVDLSLLTGESQPQHRQPGDSLPGGAVNVGQPVVLRVTYAARDSTLSVLMKLIERAGQGKPQLAQWADRVAAWFVTLLLLLVVIVFALWQWIDPARSWPIAIALLVVSCPCALSLATPTALAAATDRLVRRGVLIVQSHVLETLQRATHVIFDKTGTLTLGRPILRHVDMLGAASRAWCLQLAASLEQSSAHPLGAAIVEAARADASLAPGGAVTDLRHVPGQGLEGSLAGVRYRLGSAAFVQEVTGSACAEVASTELTAVYLGGSGGWLARFDLADGLRPDALDVVRQLQASGRTVILLSGDQPGVTQSVAAELGIGTALGGCLPQQKLAYVQALQRDGAIVAMVGDGINDAAVLKGADVSFAMGSGAALAQLHADCVLLSGRLSSVCEVADAANRTIAVIHQNLWWASLYNLIAIPAAALGWLNPWMSGIGMSVSSAVVVVNALRLRRGGRPMHTVGD
ncbi:heavy metal translocating P-type ATPase [Actimicrobium sp. GrIS 1.19]|uniref:heavy metal translocating P-type ATPase n=1 Tax=Actimicrobium sp. GrIS 1.19 TaxID=3071708 RepID=UPI003FA398B4